MLARVGDGLAYSEGWYFVHIMWGGKIFAALDIGV
jgi:hypothetical protein